MHATARGRVARLATAMRGSVPGRCAAGCRKREREAVMPRQGSTNVSRVRTRGMRGGAEVLVALALGISVVVGLAIASLVSPPEQHDERTRGLGDYRCVDTSRIYRGFPAMVRRPCTVSADAVYARIPEYQEIVRRRLSDKLPLYHFLLQDASRAFARAVKGMAKRYRHDTVAEPGAIVPARAGVPAPPDRTQEVIEELSR